MNNSYTKTRTTGKREKKVISLSRSHPSLRSHWELSTQCGRNLFI